MVYYYHPFCGLLQYKLTVPKMGNVADLLAVLSKETNIPKEKVIVMFLYLFLIYRLV